MAAQYGMIARSVTRPEQNMATQHGAIARNAARPEQEYRNEKRHERTERNVTEPKL